MSQVHHPILHLRVLARDGVQHADERVFCRLQRESVSVTECSSCNHCDAITAGPVPTVDCSFALPEAELSPDPDGERTEVGTLLRGGTDVVAASASLADALALVDAHDYRSVSVVGGDHILVGILHERTLHEQCAKPWVAALDVTVAMSRPLVLHESTPVRPALRFLASSHLRQAAVVTSAGAPASSRTSTAYGGLRASVSETRDASASSSAAPPRRNDRRPNDRHPREVPRCGGVRMASSV